MELFLGTLRDFKCGTAWFIDDEVDPPTTMLASTDPILAVRWIKEMLPEEEWLAIFNEGADLSQSQSQHPPKEQQGVNGSRKDIRNGDRGQISDGGLEDEDLL